MLDISLVNEHSNVVPNCLVGIIMEFVYKITLTQRITVLDTISFEVRSSLKAFLYKTRQV
jgi:hypothetical protein